MGIHRNQYKKLAVRIFFVLFFLITAPLLPWWIVFLLGTILLLSSVVSVELVLIGIFLDFFLVDAESGFFGLFYTLYFFAVVTAFTIFKIIDSNHEA